MSNTRGRYTFNPDIQHEVFAMNFISFLAEEYEVDWSPRRFIDYRNVQRQARDLPLPDGIKDGTRALLRDRESFFMEKFQELVPSGSDRDPRIFNDHAKSVLLGVMDTGHVVSLFNAMVYVGRLGIFFQQQGIDKTANLAIIAIALALWNFKARYGPQIYGMLRFIGHLVADLPQRAVLLRFWAFA